MTVTVVGHAMARFTAVCPWCGDPIFPGQPISRIQFDTHADWLHAHHVPATATRSRVRCPNCLGQVIDPGPPRHRHDQPPPARCLDRTCGWTDR